ncbi:tol protein, partial [Boeremia exigua]|uniref:tol protein n=1 Tax=Boeremia exigua TaxID=749465 RepID=UPI001E8CAB2A
LFLREGLAGNFRYACLSHCWGATGLKCKLVKGNKINLCQGFGIESLPNTFRDAVQICLRLSIRFLWIDALCIVQDDINDWNQTAAAMADIYRQAYITIAATASQNSSEGCFRSAPPGAIGQNLRNTPGLAVREMRWPDNPLRDEIFLTTDHPLLRRAWVFQERRMSPRMVHFTNTQLVWECGRYVKGEDGAIIRKQSDQGCSQVLNADEPTSHIRAWHETLYEYTCMRLTLEQDRLPAIAAVVVEEGKRRRADTYIAGMWIGSLLDDILWRRFSDTRGIISDAGSRPKQLAPSWSWASIRGPVWFNHEVPLASVQVVNFSFTHSGPPQMGGYKEASITLRGPYTNAT